MVFGSTYMRTVIPSLYSRGSVNVFACDFISSDLLGINSSAIQSRCRELSPEPQIIESRNSANDRFEFGGVSKKLDFNIIN